MGDNIYTAVSEAASATGDQAEAAHQYLHLRLQIVPPKPAAIVFRRMGAFPVTSAGPEDARWPSFMASRALTQQQLCSRAGKEHAVILWRGPV